MGEIPDEAKTEQTRRIVRKLCKIIKMIHFAFHIRHCDRPESLILAYYVTAMHCQFIQKPNALSFNIKMIYKIFHI